MTSPGETFRKRLKDAYARGHYPTWRAMAADIGVRWETLSRWINQDDAPNPKLDDLQRVATKLGYTLAELISDPGGKKPEPRIIYVREPGVLSAEEAEALEQRIRDAAELLRAPRGQRGKK